MKVPTTLLLLAPATTLGAVITITRTVIATVGPEIPEPTQAAPPNIIPSVPVYSGNRNSVPANGGKAGGGSDFTDAAAFQNDVLAAHNFYRKQHGAGDLVWNETSAQFGQKWSEACVFKHSGGPTGENLVAGPPNATASIDLWGQERSLFDFKSGGFSSGAGHFTQLVWKATTSVGCGRTTCNGKGGTPGTYTVCEYYPQGNIVGSNNKYFRDNVGAQIQGKPDDSAVAAAVGAVSGQSVGTGDVSSGAPSLTRSTPSTTTRFITTSISSLLGSSTLTPASSTSSAVAASVGRAFRESTGVILLTVVIAVVLEVGI